MKRDMDLIRQILIVLNEHEHGKAPSELNIQGFTDEQIGYHCFILEDGGLIRAFTTTEIRSSSPTVFPLGLTWKGHEFIDNAQNEIIWIQAKNKIKKIGGTVSLSILTNVLVDAVKETLK